MSTDTAALAVVGHEDYGGVAQEAAILAPPQELLDEAVGDLDALATPRDYVRAGKPDRR